MLAMTTGPSDYERRARDQIHEWKHPKRGWFGETMQQIGWPVKELGTLIKNATVATGLWDVVTKAIAGTARMLGDAAAWAVSSEAIYAEFRKAGHDVQQCTNLFELDLKQVDEVVGRLDAKYVGLAFAEGATAGALGVPGLIADIPALISLNLRAIAEYATYYGFDVASQRERLFVMQVLGLASSPSDAAKAQMMAQLARIASDAARKRAWAHLEKDVLVRAIQGIAKALSIRLTKAKLAQAVPIVGAAVGGGFNAYYTARVCEAASQLYRERFLAEKYGPDVIDLTTQPVEEVESEPLYPEASEEITSDVGDELVCIAPDVGPE